MSKSNSALAVHFSSKKTDWETPQDLFDQLNREFDFTLDVCANPDNAKCDFFFGPQLPPYTFLDGLTLSWILPGRERNCCWMNPPYGREIGKWVKKAYEESLKGCTVVALLPSRTDTRYFHEYIYNKPNVEIRFVRGRIRFVGAKSVAPFPSMIVVFRPR